MTIEQLMEKLHCTKAEALDIIRTDEAIEKGANPFPLSKNQEQASKKARAVGRAVGVYQFSKRERKADNDKRHLINEFLSLLENAECVANIETANPEREILFTFNEKKYKITLSAPRK